MGLFKIGNLIKAKDDAAFSEVPGGRPPSFSRLICGGPPAPLPTRRAYRPEGKAYGSERSLGTKEKAESPLALMNISHLRCGPVGVRFIEPAMTGVINAAPTKT